MNDLTPRQAQIMRFIISEIEANAIAPSGNEILHHLGISSRQSLQRHLEALKEKGYIEKRYGATRHIRVRIDPDNNPSEAIKLSDQ